MSRNAISAEDWASYAAELGQRLNRARVAGGLSQEDVAYGAGLSRYTYQKFEKGESRPGTPSNPHLRTLLAIAGALGIPPSELLPEWNPPVKP
ncbi:MAG: XRE family transcriptional regulator [Microbacterium sp.]|nr:XRE family transcriptional regulator [Microbacterium sp.]MBA4345879.1 XRE family transcriptional regulator [Microbacterium sp.]